MMKKLALPLATALACMGLTVPVAHAQDTAQCEDKVLAVTSGTVKWGIKHSWRGYVRGPIARGTWKTAGAVTEVGSDPKSKQFTFNFEVDDATSYVRLGRSGVVTDAVIHTKPSVLSFTGHKGSMDSTMVSPYIVAKADGLKAGVSYRGFYVPGKEMTSYKPEDRNADTKVEGKGTFTKSADDSKVQWTTTGNTVSLKAQDMTIAPQPGTDANKNIINGVDIVFLGIYSPEYKPEFDDITVELETKEVCLSNADEALRKVAAGELGEYAGERGAATKFDAATVALIESVTGPVPAGTKTPTTTPSTTPTTTPSTTPSATTTPAPSNNQDGLSASKGRGIWGIVLAIISVVGVVAILGKAIIDALQKFMPRR
ncbi:HtaA domain-containing protein [Corynebacterium sp. HS2168-gen11]|uniref:HtaA domain-containing protein n=1 Tax=Corynebacterium sp. HS2168-gen11 TaxID=2974027 RepID=UPI00216B5541|nr:HtaA domain-containing protein [Corynebacterium sp. HS2168-gen11]MCS4535890.1 HtaA domain-containing protein [Corynebacterium sp. HS2168-gen11]